MTPNPAITDSFFATLSFDQSAEEVFADVVNLGGWWPPLHESGWPR